MKLKLDKGQKSKYHTILYIKYAIIALILSITHIVFLDFISIGGITPDLLLILVVWIALAEGHFVGLFAGFLIGLVFDVVSSDVVGINALTKTVAAFIAGWFYREGKTDQIIGSFRFLIIVFICSMVHNLFYFFFYIKLTEISFLSFFLRYGIAISSYTTVFAIFAMVFKITKKRL